MLVYPGGPNVIIRALVRGRQKGQTQRDVTTDEVRVERYVIMLCCCLQRWTRKP